MIRIVLRGAAILFLCTVPLSAAAQATTTDASTSAIVATATPAVESLPAVHTNAGVESRVRAVFADTPVMIAIARCESGFRQFDDGGAPLDGGAGNMIGVFQISAAVHRSPAHVMGMDIDTTEGNIAYANYLYRQEGTDPWLSSYSCWNAPPTLDEQTDAGAAGVLRSDLVLGTVSPEVATLQRLLNTSSTPVAANGPGSPGQETQKFGALTRAAVRAFQCARQIVCSGDEYSTGYGAVGEKTRAALLALALSAPAVPRPSSDTDAEIAQLKAQIAQLQQVLAQLLAQKNNLALK